MRGPATRIPVVWPAASKARMDPIEVIVPSQHLVARAGAVLRFGGGPGPVRPGRRCMLGRHSAAFVLSQIFVLPRRQ
jgi:hypothetical protein